MGLILLLLVGAILGWLGSIVLRREDKTGILTCVSAGMAGSLLVGFLTGSVSLLSGVGGLQLIWASLGAIAAVALASMVRARSFR